MKRLLAITAALGMMVLANTASAYEFTPGQICQASDATSVSYIWTQLYSSSGAYVICPVTRTYSSVSAAKAYVSNPSGGTTSGWINFVSTDGSYSNYNYASTSTEGNVELTFAAINNPSGYNGFVNFELYVPAGGGIRGLYSN